MLPSVYTSCQESQTNRDPLLKGLPSAEALWMLSLAWDTWAEATQSGAWQGKSPQSPAQHHPPSTAKAGLREGHSSAGGHSCPQPAQKQLLWQPSPWITLKQALQLQENAKLWTRTSRDRSVFQEQVSIGLWCWLASACRVPPGCCRDEDWGQHHHSLCFFSFPLCIFGVKDQDQELQLCLTCQDRNGEDWLQQAQDLTKKG